MEGSKFVSEKKECIMASIIYSNVYIYVCVSSKYLAVIWFTYS